MIHSTERAQWGEELPFRAFFASNAELNGPDYCEQNAIHFIGLFNVGLFTVNNISLFDN